MARRARRPRLARRSLALRAVSIRNNLQHKERPGIATGPFFGFFCIGSGYIDETLAAVATSDVAASVALLVALEVSRLMTSWRMLAAIWQRPVVAMLRIEVVVHRAMEVGRPMKPPA